MAKTASERWPSAGEFGRALQSVEREAGWPVTRMPVEEVHETRVPMDGATNPGPGALPAEEMTAPGLRPARSGRPRWTIRRPTTLPTGAACSVPGRRPSSRSATEPGRSRTSGRARSGPTSGPVIGRGRAPPRRPTPARRPASEQAAVDVDRGRRRPGGRRPRDRPDRPDDRLAGPQGREPRSPASRLHRRPWPPRWRPARSRSPTNSRRV